MKINQLDLKHLRCGQICDYSDAYISVEGTIIVTAPEDNNNANNIRDKKIDH